MFEQWDEVQQIELSCQKFVKRWGSYCNVY